MTSTDPTSVMMDLATSLAEATATAQKAGLELLQAELHALTTLMPGLAPSEEDEARQEAERRAVEAAVEEGFDNMPV
jgi:methionine synthase II (cobalamin-independent)